MREEYYNTLYNNMLSLIEKLNYHTKLYEEGKYKPGVSISDAEWDEMYFTLQNIEKELNVYLPNSPTQSVQYHVVNELRKVKHNHPMLSLDKTKDWNTFIHYFMNKDVVGMLKLDGLTCSLHYVDGVLIGAETRGNGEEGEDIFHNALVVKNIPNRINYTDELIIDGEIICTIKNFEEFKQDYANPRNFAAGSIRLLDAKECAARNLKFVAWNVVKGPCDTVIENFAKIFNLGFTVVPWVSSWDWDSKDFLLEKATELGYPIDGLVGRFNNIEYGESLGSTGHHSKAAYAFKFCDEIYETELLDIEWTMGRTGVLTPVAIVNPIEMDGCEVTRASLHNISIMHDTLGLPYVGQKVEIFKANEIIPQIKRGDAPIVGKKLDYIEIPTICPICGGQLMRSRETDTEVLKCTNSECIGQLINRLDHFAGKKGLDIKGLSKATLEKLIEWGWVSQPADLYSLQCHRTDWINKPGFGQKSVDNILEAIEASRCPKLDSFISALGIPMIGRTISKSLINHIESYEDFREKAKTHWDFTTIEGIAWEKASAIWNFNFDEADAVNECMITYNIASTPNYSMSLEGETICITGRLIKFKNRNDLITEIESRGGKVTSAVSKNTTYLINNDINSTSTKNITATRLGIPIITEEEFFNLYLTN